MNYKLAKNQLIQVRVVGHYVPKHTRELCRDSKSPNIDHNSEKDLDSRPTPRNLQVHVVHPSRCSRLLLLLTPMVHRSINRTPAATSIPFPQLSLHTLSGPNPNRLRGISNFLPRRRYCVSDIDHLPFGWWALEGIPVLGALLSPS